MARVAFVMDKMLRITSLFLKKYAALVMILLYIGILTGILAMLSPAGALPLLVFCLLYTPCVAAIASIKRELGVKHAVFVVIGQCMIAWIMAFVVRMIMMI